MPIKKTASKTKETAPAVKKRAKPQPRVEGVREIMLSLLAAGPLSRKEIVKRGKFSEGALYTNLKTLRDEDLIEGEPGTRKLRLKGGSAPTAVASVPAVPVKLPAAEVVKLPVHVPRALHEALDSVAFRLSPIDRAGEKLMVLEQLARTTPKPVADILRLLVDDVAKLSALLAE